MSGENNEFSDHIKISTTCEVIFLAPKLKAKENINKYMCTFIHHKLTSSDTVIRPTRAPYFQQGVNILGMT
jgi:hypothetical protein